MDDNFHAWKAISMAKNASIQIFNENLKSSQYLLHKFSYLPHFVVSSTFSGKMRVIPNRVMYPRYLYKVFGITNIFV